MASDQIQLILRTEFSFVAPSLSLVNFFFFVFVIRIILFVIIVLLSELFLFSVLKTVLTVRNP